MIARIADKNMNIKVIKKGMLTTFTAIVLPIAASGALVVDGSFAAPPDGSPSFVTIGVGATIGGPIGWTVTAGSVDVINGYWQTPPLGGQSLDMEGVNPGTISETISGLLTGQKYVLSFFMSGNPDGAPTTKTLAVSLGGAPQDVSYTLTGANSEANMLWTPKSVVFTAASTAELLPFSDLSGPPGTYGGVIGDVSLTAVPEVSTFIAGTLL